jgi:hypothetical protein
MRTRELKVANVAFLINKIGQECTDWQYLRELVKNGMDAIGRVRALRPDFAGRITAAESN